MLRGLRAGYGASFMLDGVSLRAGPGNLVGLIGPNGGGKSTLLRAVAGVLKPQRGEVLFAGRPIRESAARIAFVPQREEVNWDFPVSARDVVLMGTYRATGWLRLPGRSHREAADAALERLGLGGLGSRHISQFSGGQQQRIFLARALAQNPLVVLLDEPFTGIDADNREMLHRLLRLLRAAGAVVMMATHDLDEVASTCSHVCCLNRKVVAFGPAGSTLTAANLRATFGGQVAILT